MALTEILDDLRDTASSEEVNVGDAIDAFEHRSLGAILTLFATVAALPVIGAIPGVSIVTGTLIIAAIIQSLFASGGIWAPDRLRRQTVSADKLESAIASFRPWAERIDNLLKKRLTVLASGPVARYAIPAASILLALSFYPLAVVPAGVYAPSLAILALGLALLGKDGLFATIGFAFAGLTVGLLLWVL